MAFESFAGLIMQELRTWLSVIGDSSAKVSRIWTSSSTRSISHTYDSETAQHNRREEKQAETHGHHASMNYFNNTNNNIRQTLIRYVFSVLSLLWFLLPRRGRPLKAKAFHELHPMCYLDALRGYLAMIIFTGHNMSRHWKWIPEPILAVPWLQFPVRGGHTSLDIFFWISGYAITYKMVGFMHAKRHDKVFDTLASSIFRRYLRLFLPVVLTTFATTVALELGIAILPAYKKKEVINQNLFVYWLKDTGRALNPFAHTTSWWVKDGRAGTELLEQFWSINTEFRSSMMLFCFCAATCKMSSSKRKMVIWLCIPAFICWQVQWAAMAFLGMWFAECRQQRTREAEAKKSLVMAANVQSEKPATLIPVTFSQAKDEKQRLDSGPKNSLAATFKLPVWAQRPSGSWTSLDRSGKSGPKIHKFLLVVLFLYSFVFLKDPHSIYKGDARFPHNLINRSVPDHWPIAMRMHIHLVIGASMMVYSLDRLPILQRPLLTPFSQYLGELSFGIYAVHVTVRWIVWDARYLKWAQERYGHKEFDCFSVLFPGWIMMALTVLWAADLFRRMDILVVKFCRDLELRLFE